MLKKVIHKVPLYKKRVLLCVDYNVPLSNNLTILNAFRIEKTLTTIKYLLEQKAKIIIISHIGRPNGYEKDLSLKPVANYLSKILKQHIYFLNSCIHKSTLLFIEKMEHKQIVMLENLRFHDEEKKKNITFAQRLASYADLYINDAFSTLHRDQSSNMGIPLFLPSAFGFLIEEEVKKFIYFLNKPIKNKIILLGGSKISTKISYLEKLIDKAETLVFGGAMSYTLLKSLGIDIGNSFIEENYISYCKYIFQIAKKNNTEIILPLDHLICSVKDFENKKNNRNNKIIKSYIKKYIDKNYLGVDVGPKTLNYIFNKLKHVQNIFWNGPFGIFEYPEFEKGTYELSKFIAELNIPLKIVGGGNTINALYYFAFENKFHHLSTGGGAALKFIGEKGNLPSINIIENQEYH